MGITFGTGKGKEPQADLPRVAFIPAGASDEDVTRILNSVIDKMRQYGVITFPRPKGHGRKIMWSNGSAQWWTYGQAEPSTPASLQDRYALAGIEPRVSLDANQVLVVGSNHLQLRRVCPKLNPLPLYAGSFEARSRGNFSFAGNEIPPRVREAHLKGEDLDDQTRQALEDKFRES